MAEEISPEEKAEIKGEIRKMMDKELQERGQEGFMDWLVDEWYEAGRMATGLQDRLIMGRGAQF